MDMMADGLGDPMTNYRNASFLDNKFLSGKREGRLNVQKVLKLVKSSQAKEARLK